MHRRTLTLVAAALLLVATGCASGDDDPSTEPSPSDSMSRSTPASSEPNETEETEKAVEITVSVSDGKVQPKPHRVDVPLGSQVRLQVTSDVDDELHVHGYDIEETLEAGRTTMVDFTADQQGVFEVETHETELELLQLEVR
jgi:SHS2 domain-containing protein